jgi:hypothetical protein
MGRDKNAPANFVIRHQALVATGEVPWQFQRGTELEYPEAPHPRAPRLSSVQDCDQSLSSSRASLVQATRYKYHRCDSVTLGQAGALGQAGCGRLRTTKTNLH